MVLYNIGDQIKWRFEIMAYVYFKSFISTLDYYQETQFRI